MLPAWSMPAMATRISEPKAKLLTTMLAVVLVANSAGPLSARITALVVVGGVPSSV